MCLLPVSVLDVCVNQILPEKENEAVSAPAPRILGQIFGLLAKKSRYLQIPSSPINNQSRLWVAKISVNKIFLSGKFCWDLVLSALSLLPNKSSVGVF